MYMKRSSPEYMDVHACTRMKQHLQSFGMCRVIKSFLKSYKTWNKVFSIAKDKNITNQVKLKILLSSRVYVPSKHMKENFPESSQKRKKKNIN